MKKKKTDAVSRTVDIFTGKTQAEELAAAIEQIEGTHRGSETIEQASERWRANAFFTQEFVSRPLVPPATGEVGPGTPPATGQSIFRLTEREGWFYLERFGISGGGKHAYSYTGVMFPTDDLYDLTTVLVAAARNKRSKQVL